MPPSYVALQQMNEMNFIYFLLEEFYLFSLFLTLAAVGCKATALTLSQMVLGNTCGAQGMGATGCGNLHHLDMQNEPKILAEEAEGESL